jgi:acetyl esterase/lipase
MDRSILSRPGPEPDQTLRYGDGADHAVDAWLPSATADRPLVVVVHGGFWRAGYDRTHTRLMCAVLRDAGWPAAAIEYRRLGGVRTPLSTTFEMLSTGFPRSCPAPGSW